MGPPSVGRTKWWLLLELHHAATQKSNSFQHSGRLGALQKVNEGEVVWPGRMTIRPKAREIQWEWTPKGRKWSTGYLGVLGGSLRRAGGCWPVLGLQGPPPPLKYPELPLMTQALI